MWPQISSKTVRGRERERERERERARKEEIWFVTGHPAALKPSAGGFWWTRVCISSEGHVARFLSCRCRHKKKILPTKLFCEARCHLKSQESIANVRGHQWTTIQHCSAGTLKWLVGRQWQSTKILIASFFYYYDRHWHLAGSCLWLHSYSKTVLPHQLVSWGYLWVERESKQTTNTALQLGKKESMGSRTSSETTTGDCTELHNDCKANQSTAVRCNYNSSLQSGLTLKRPTNDWKILLDRV